MAPVLLHIIESDTLTRDALYLYLGKSYNFRILWSGPHESYVESDKLEADVVIVGQQYGKNFADTLKELNLDAQNSMDIVLLGFEFTESDLLELTSYPAVKGFLLKNEIKRDIGGAILRTQAGATVFTKTVAETFLMSANHTPIKQAEIVRSLITIDERKETEITLLYFAVFGFSKEEVAEELCISLNTASSRIRSAYEKLGVSNRHEAFEAITQVKEDPFSSETYSVQ